MALDNRLPEDAFVDAGGMRVVRLHDADPHAGGEFSGPEAADLAGISYRQLDYWARRQWVVPSRVDCEGVQRRVYTTADIVRLAALGHLGRSHIDVATYGEATGRLRVSDTMGALVVWAIHDETVGLASSKDLRRVTSQPGRYVIFDPAPLLRSLGRRRAEMTEARPKRRTFTAAYKLGILAEYERLTEPGAKGALLRREGLHTSHLVAWRRGRETGELVQPIRRSGAHRPAAAATAASKQRTVYKAAVVAAATATRPA
ncbi:MAG: MerR family transcriptional regulator [Acidimicrobiales bacterium]